jgi:small-conductance mechanosensitive channel
MPMRAALRLIVLCLVLLPSGLRAQDAPAPAPTQPSGQISVADDAAVDRRIAGRIRDILGQLDGYSEVRVSVSAGIVTLSGRALDREALVRLEQLVSRVEGVVAIRNEVAESTDLGERLTPAVERFRNRLAQTIAFAPLILVALLVGAAIAALGVFLAGRDRLWARLAPNGFIADVYRQLVKIAFAVAAVVAALDILGATALLGTFLGAAGLVGLAIGFAVRDSVENFIASVMLSLRQPFRPNDLVEIEGDTGRVVRLTSRATILLSLDGNHIRIPNATVFKARILNYSSNPERRFQFDLGVDADADLAAVREVALAALRGLPFVLANPAAGGWVEEVGDSNVLLRFIGWIDQRETDFALSRGEAIRIVKTAIEAAGFGLPEPIYRVRLDDAAGLLAAAPGAGRPARPPAKPAPAPARPAPVATDPALEKFVEEERSATAGKDLLDRAAPHE